MKSYPTYSDQELVRLLQRGDHAAFSVLYERYWEMLLGMAFNRLKDLSAAEDIVHDVFTSLWKNRESLNIQSFKNWMATAVKYMIIRAADRASLEERFAEDQRKNEVVEDSLADSMADKQMAAMLATEINRLPEKCRIVFQLKLQGLSNSEIADEMGTTVKTVENQVNRGNHSLKVAMKNYFFSLLFI